MEAIPKSARSIAAYAALALTLAACDSPVGPAGGAVQFTLSAGDGAAAAAGEVAGPAASGDDDWKDGGWHPDRPRLQSANVTLSSVLARNFEGVLLDVDMELPVTVDIVAMADRGRSVTLPEGNLPPGMYDQVVVVMTAVQVVTADGTTITVEPPGGGWTAIVNLCPFEVADGDVTPVALELPVRTAFSWNDGRVRFEPRFRAHVGSCEVPPLDES
jgi:hypothetical protein